MDTNATNEHCGRQFCFPLSQDIQAITCRSMVNLCYFRTEKCEKYFHTIENVRLSVVNAVDTVNIISYNSGSLPVLS